MNAKIMKGKSAGGLIDYLNNMKEKNAKVIFSNGVSTTSNRTVVAAFNLQWANSSSKIKDKMGHLVISFSPKDRERLTDEFITELCKEYMQRMNHMRQQLCTFSKCLQIYPGKIRTFCSIKEKKRCKPRQTYRKG